MTPLSKDSRFEIMGSSTVDRAADFANAVRTGLSASPKFVPARFLYDDKGSDLFEKITELPEYYLTRAELEILVNNADEIASSTETQPTLVEFGSGSSKKARALVSALINQYGHLVYAPIDISRHALEGSASGLLSDYPDLKICAVLGEYERGLTKLDEMGNGPRLILWLGSNVGNMTNEEARNFLFSISQRMRPRDQLLVGVDLVKAPEVIRDAYDDSQGVTSAFTLNLIDRINRELEGNLVSKNFQYFTRWNSKASRMESFLQARCDHTAFIGSLKLELSFNEGELIHTEYSQKFTPQSFGKLANLAKLKEKHHWIDSEGRFISFLLEPLH